MNNVYLIFNKEVWEGYRADLASLIKERNKPEFIISYIYKFKIFLSLALSYSFIYTNI